MTSTRLPNRYTEPSILVSAPRYCGPLLMKSLYAAASSPVANLSRALGCTRTPTAPPRLRRTDPPTAAVDVPGGGVLKEAPKARILDARPDRIPSTRFIGGCTPMRWKVGRP